MTVRLSAAVVRLFDITKPVSGPCSSTALAPRALPTSHGSHGDVGILRQRNVLCNHTELMQIHTDKTEKKKKSLTGRNRTSDRLISAVIEPRSQGNYSQTLYQLSYSENLMTVASVLTIPEATRHVK